MKKIITIILFAAGTVSFAAAQSNDHRDIAYNNNKKMSNDYGHYANSNYNDSYFFSLRAKEAKLKQINQEYDQKMNAVKSNWHLSSRKKAKQIQLLQIQRKNEISQVEKQYEKANHKADHHDSKKW